MRFLLFMTLFGVLVGCGTTRNIEPKAENISNFDQRELTLIKKGNDAAPMRVYLITNAQDSILLRQKSKPVHANPNDPSLELFTKRLLATVKDSMSMGVGIAAPQVGILSNIIWIQRFDKEGFPFEVYLNPVIKQYSSKKQPCPEGCLSIPDKRATTQNRAYAIMIEYDRMDGTHITEMVEDFTAVIFQHEIDHLNGILFTDHLEKDLEEAN